jgi:ribonuclease P protein component
VRRVEQDLLLKFPRTNRLVKQHDFQSVFRSSHKIVYKYLLVIYLFNRKIHPRLGIIIGKRLVNRASRRNLIRRIVRESFRHHQKLLKGLDLIVMMRSKCSPLPTSSLNKKVRLNLGGKQYNHVLRNDINNLWQQLAATLKRV